MNFEHIDPLLAKLKDDKDGARRDYQLSPPKGHVAYEPASPTLRDWLAISVTFQLQAPPLAKTVAHQHERLPGRLARCTALAATAGAHLLHRRNLLRPFLDDDRRIDDSFTALSSLHRDRARREAVTANQ